jgi:hypothetical protein
MLRKIYGDSGNLTAMPVILPDGLTGGSEIGGARDPHR